MDVPTLQAARASALSVGQTSVDVATFGGDLSAAIAARGASGAVTTILDNIPA